MKDKSHKPERVIRSGTLLNCLNKSRPSPMSGGVWMYWHRRITAKHLYSGIKASEAERPRDLEIENKVLKRLMAGAE